MKYKFGVMSSKYELEAEDERVAKICMCIHLKTTAPIAIYEPEQAAINPTEILRDNKENIPAEGIRKCMPTIKKVV